MHFAIGFVGSGILSAIFSTAYFANQQRNLCRIERQIANYVVKDSPHTLQPRFVVVVDTVLLEQYSFHHTLALGTACHTDKFAVRVVVILCQSLLVAFFGYFRYIAAIVLLIESNDRAYRQRYGNEANALSFCGFAYCFAERIEQETVGTCSCIGFTNHIILPDNKINPIVLVLRIH